MSEKLNEKPVDDNSGAKKSSTLTIESISKTYKGRKVVNQVSFQVKSGECVGLLGPNGAGKTTSFYMVVGLVRPDEGQVLVDGQPIADLPMFRRARMGLSYLPQEASIFRKLTVWENIAIAFEAVGIVGARREELIGYLVEEFKLTHVKDSYGYALSGGERRRVELARALATRPKFLLLDEPFAGIDPIAVGEIQQMIARLKEKGLGILITDHNVRETLSICDHAYIMKEGAIQVQGDRDEIATSDIAKKFYLGENFRL
jgi:lipopolysaccharide export system ATP-binding protein